MFTPPNYLICCSNMSTIVSSDQGSIFSLCCRVVLNRQLMADMPKTKITPRAKYPDRRRKFLTDVKVALETFEDEVGSLLEKTRSGTYKNFLQAYREALIPLWNLAHCTSIDTVLATVANPQMTDLAVMARHLQPACPSSTVIKEKRSTPDLETMMKALKDMFPAQSLPNSKVCAMIGEVFAKLGTANKAYAEAAKLLADLSTLVMPEQYTMLLTVVTTPAIQIVMPGQLMSPISAQSPSPTPATTTLGRSDIMKKTKLRVLPNPKSQALATCDKSSATRVLTTAVFSKLECHYFDETMSRIDIVGKFKCSMSQLSKAVTGVDYASGPHHYKQKEKKTPKKRTSAMDTNPEPAKRTSCVPEKSGSTTTSKSQAVQEDTLSSSSSSSSEDLPLGLL